MFFQTLSAHEILSRLKEANDRLSKLGQRATIIITGGSALSLLTSGQRVTQDIDYIGNLPLSTKELQELSMSNDVESVWVVPDISEMSFDLEYKFSNLVVKVLSWEDLAVMKFYSKREKDYDDLVNYILGYIKSFDSLKRRLDYYKPDYVGDINSGDLNLNCFDEIVQKFAKKNNVVFVEGSTTLERALKSARVYSKFVRGATWGINLEKANSCQMRVCLSTVGFHEALYRVTGKDFRIW